jgi:hypothetical protein
MSSPDRRLEILVQMLKSFDLAYEYQWRRSDSDVSRVFASFPEILQRLRSAAPQNSDRALCPGMIGDA